MSSEKGSSKADTLVKVILVFFISLLSFSVGTFVGKQVSDSDHRRMALEGEYKTDRQVASTDAKADADATDKVTDKDVESLTDEFVNKEKTAATEAAAQKDDGDSDTTTEKTEKDTDHAGYKTYSRNGKMAKKETSGKKTADKTREVANKVASGKAPTDGASEPRKPASTLPAVANAAVGKYTVQVASYADEKEAQTHAADLKGKGWNAFYVPATVSGKTWYRVSVGIFDTMRNAKEFSSQFMKDANTKSAIVQKIVQ